jgi:serine/threonine-protein kinase HipA
MAKKRTRVPLNILLNGRMVGVLRRATSGAIDFQYDKQWLDWENTFAISLSLPLREDRYIGDTVIAVFDNLLPDTDEIRNTIAARQHADGTDAYSLLTAIGRDCVGALQFVPTDENPGRVGDIRATPASSVQIADRLSNLASAPLGINDDEEFRISIAGAQQKTAYLYWKNNWHVPHGSTPTTHIFKPQIGMVDGRDLTQSVENEYLCMQIIQALGMPVARTQISDFGDRRVLVVERFDRQWTKDKRLLRVPQEDCCQALTVPPTRKYENQGGPGILGLLEFLKASDTPVEDRNQFLKAQIVFWLLAATDGHAKNFSVALYPGGGFKLTPLYDVLSTQHLFDNGQLRRGQMKLAMAIGDNRHYRLHEIIPRHFLQTAKAAGMPEADVHAMFDALAIDMPKAIDKVCKALPEGFPAVILDSILAGINQRLKRIDVG